MRGSRRKLGLAGVLVVVVLSGLVGQAWSAEKASAAAKLVAGVPGASIVAPRTLSTALPLRNDGDVAAGKVAVLSISLAGAKLVAPSKLPVLAGIKPGSSTTIFATFKGPALRAGKPYVVRVGGTYATATGQAKFFVRFSGAVPPAAPGKAVAKTSAILSHRTEGKRFPHQKPRFTGEVNDNPQWAVPVGPFRSPGPRSKTTGPKPAKSQKRHTNSSDRFGTKQGTIAFQANDALGLGTSTIAEPSGAVGGKVLFVTANWLAAYSTNGGASFTSLDPTTIFPQNTSVGGYCCDQIVQYVPSIDRFIWMMQQSTGDRIAAASPAAIMSSHGTAWTYWDIQASQLGPFTGFDYPDMSVGTNSLYLSTDAGPGLMVMRFPLAQIKAGTTVNFFYTDPSNSTVAYFGHLAQNARDEIFWAGHVNNSTMRVFSWQESTATYFWRDVGIGTWPNNETNMTSTTPDRQDWVTKLRDDNIFFITGITRVFQTPQGRAVNQIWFSWTAAGGNGFPHPQVQIVVLDRSNNFARVSQMSIWNPDYSFGYPALTVNATGDVAMSLEYGGGARWEDHVVGFWGHYVVYITTSTNQGTDRFGDYVTIRPNPNDGSRFDAFGYGIRNGTGDVHYVQFSR